MTALHLVTRLVSEVGAGTVAAILKDDHRFVEEFIARVDMAYVQRLIESRLSTETKGESDEE